MSVNDGYTKSSAYLHTSKCKLFHDNVKDKAVLRTSTTLKDVNDKEYIIPLDNDDHKISTIEAQQRRLIVDELDQRNENVINQTLTFVQLNV